MHQPRQQEYRRVGECCTIQPVPRFASMPPTAPPIPEKPVAVPTSCPWKRSVGSVCRFDTQKRVAEGDEARGADGHPGRGHQRREDRGRHHRGSQQHDELARLGQRPARAHQPAGEPSAQHVAYAAENERHPGVLADHGQIEAALLRQVFGQPEDHEVDHRVGEEARQDQRVAFAHADHLAPVHARRAGRGGFFGRPHVVLELLVFVAPQPAILVRRLIEQQPDRHPHQPDRAGEHERRAPAEADRQERDHRRRQRRAERRSGIEDADSERALARRKPFAPPPWPRPASCPVRPVRAQNGTPPATICRSRGRAPSRPTTRRRRKPRSPAASPAGRPHSPSPHT